MLRPKMLRMIVYLVIVFAIILVLSFYKIYDLELFKNTNTEYSVTVVGLIISVIAFVLAFLTYLSIDNVNKISQMEGNVLENENYMTSFTSLIKEYNMSDSKEFAEHIFTKLKVIFKKESKTAIQFADNLQYMIDILVFLPYLYHKKEEKEENQRRMQEMLLLMNKRMTALMAVSNGNLVLIKESVKLINSVLFYQKHVYSADFNIASSLLEVRGNMLRNPVTQTVYYNYLGLFYQKKAIAVLQNKYDLPEGNMFSLQRLKQAKEIIGSMHEDDKELFIIYLKEAKKSFNTALEQGTDDIMWEGFIKYNAARTIYLLSLVNEAEQEIWHKVMDEALAARYKLNILIEDIVQSRTHLQENLQHENNLANLVKINILMAEGMDITNRVGQVKYTAPMYNGLKDDPILTVPFNDHFQVIPQLQQEITGYLSDQQH
jgi:hypothetical protein